MDYKVIVDIGSVKYCVDDSGRRFFRAEMKTPPNIEVGSICLASIASQFAVNLQKREKYQHLTVEALMLKLLHEAVSSIDDAYLKVIHLKPN